MGVADHEGQMRGLGTLRGGQRLQDREVEGLGNAHFSTLWLLPLLFSEAQAS